MGTRSTIAMKKPEGGVVAIYCHWDGYPAHNGDILNKHWTDTDKIAQLIGLGDLSSLGTELGEKQDFDNRETQSDGWCLAYGRDRGEKGCGYRVYKDEAEYIREGFNSGEQYVYLMKLDGDVDYMNRPKGTWYFVESRYTEQGKEVIDDAFRPLVEVAIQDHIDIWKRTLEDYKKRKAA